MKVADMHFHCPDCHPQLVRGQTPAICGQTIPPAIVGNGPVRKCAGCKRARRKHAAGHKARA
ncbi:hypothetical protein [Streptomyces sp. NPDC020747]|uniref:hypothetical protein n=1 Tax=Streptomyces sp. NPDC020747 TaxID=3365086 RepID=UPI0037BA60ED